MKLTRKDLFAVLALLGLLFLYFPDVFFARSAPLVGDHYEQHFPWAYLLSSSLREFRLPLWTNAIHCGFPIAAEGQISVFYLPQLLLYFLLPIRWAYAYLLLVHLLLSGTGTYFYARSIRMERPGALIAAAVFLFGAGLGGAFYNITSLKTISWFPFMLLAFEFFLRTAKKRYLIFLALGGAFSILAGYLQVALFTLGFFALYGLCRVFVFNETGQTISEKIGCSVKIFAALAGAAVLSLPQLFLTYQLSILSNRFGLSEEYAYLGPMSPLAVMTMIFPSMQPILRANCLYLGIPSIVFLLGSFLGQDVKRTSAFKLWLSLSLAAFFLALGKWGGIYYALVKLTHFYSFRMPSKFVVFCCFGLSILCGMGFQTLYQASLKGTLPALLIKLRRPYLAFAGALIGVYAVLNLLITVWSQTVLRIGRWLIEKFVYGRAGHPYSLETYQTNLVSFMGTVRNVLSPLYFWNLLAIVLTAATYFVFFGNPWIKKSPRSVCVLGLMLLVLDLGFYSCWDLRADLDVYSHALRANPVNERLKSEKALGRVGRIHGIRPFDRVLPVIPSVNILLGIEDTGVYSPLVLKRYHESIGLLGNVNDSNFRYMPSSEFILQRLSLLDFLDVSHLLSSSPLHDDSLKLIETEDEYGSYLYENLGEHRLAYFITQTEVFENWDKLRDQLMKPHFDPRKILLLEQSEMKKTDFFKSDSAAPAEALILLEKRSEESEEWQVESNQSGFFVVSETAFPGWQASVNGRRVPLLKAYGLFRALWLGSPGKYEIKFEYKPFSPGES